MQGDSSLINEIADMLMDSTLFSGFSPAEVRSIARYFGISKIDGDGIIFREGDIGHFMCIVNSGRVSIRKANREGENVEVATLVSDRTFGEMAVLDGERRSATCIAATECMLLTLSKDSLDKMLEDTPRTAAKVIRAVAVALSKRLRMADGKLVDYQV
jgi:CRP-like cAMP-binding protein